MRSDDELISLDAIDAMMDRIKKKAKKMSLAEDYSELAEVLGRYEGFHFDQLTQEQKSVLVLAFGELGKVLCQLEKIRIAQMTQEQKASAVVSQAMTKILLHLAPPERN